MASISRKSVKLLCNELDAGLIGLLETKVKMNKIKEVASSMFGGWEYRTNHNSHYNGRIWIVWRSDWYGVDVKSESAQVIITCHVRFIPSQVQFYVTFLYTFNTKEERSELWDYLRQIHLNCAESWIILGDFNSVLHPEDRIGGNLVTLGEVVDFQKCLDDYVLEEMSNTGCQFTWNDKQVIDGVFSKIYWVLANGDWLDTMPQCVVDVLPEGVSGHCPLMVKLVEDRIKKQGAFKFCNIWSTSFEFCLL
ncbi:hypothetical protein K7X08_011906 [Anisodus acutangulus]|uniref:Endonuclease/exonuclease/phosphatase domain-containing protein n=1 Tax=Anisodus acutangulus TaxID=402998 RepID=A0A9Q1QZU8_9SOLA|nr:hypothetical protein K7X08_011906 [Anisodus acutangulus]